MAVFVSIDDEREARVAKELIEAAGGYAAEAARIAEAVRKPGPTVLEAMTEHIDLLTGVGADTRSHYRQQMTDKGLAPKTIANVHGLLSAAMTTATCLGCRTGNPCVGVELPKSVSTRDEMTVLTRDEFGLLLSKVSVHYRPLVLTLVATGLRWGEATTLTAGDVDLAARPATLRVTKAWKRDEDRHWYVGPPKTRRARRTVSLPDDLVDALLPLVAAKAPDALLFTNTVGSQLSSSRFWTTTWTLALDAACNPRRADGTPDLDAPRLTKRPRDARSAARRGRRSESSTGRVGVDSQADTLTTATCKQ
ncbi:MAG: tyrosine-type recombinase/integrase [Actinomycetes bacterium]